jgi:hypothetical protein
MSSAYSGNTIRYINGEVRLIANDLATAGFNQRWGHTAATAINLAKTIRSERGSMVYSARPQLLARDAMGRFCSP